MTSQKRAYRASVIAGTSMAFLVLATSAVWGYWSTSGSGAGSATTATLNPPASASATGASTSTVSVTVTAGPSGGAPASSYRVDRITAPAVTGACTISGATGSCNAAASGTGTNEYRIYSQRGTGANVAWTSSAFTAVSSAPLAVAATSVSPASRGRNMAAPATVTISGNGFASGATVSFGSNIAVGTTTFVNSSTLTVPVTVTATAAVGARNVTVTNGGGGATLVCPNCFTVNAAPTVTSAAQTLPRTPQTTVVTVAGTGFVNGITAAIAGAAGYVVNSTEFVSATSIKVSITNNTTSGSQKRDLVLTNPDAGRVTQVDGIQS